VIGVVLVFTAGIGLEDNEDDRRAMEKGGSRGKYPIAIPIFSSCNALISRGCGEAQD